MSQASKTTLDPTAIEQGDDLPKLEIPITAKRIVAGALASQDYQDVHHDKAAAQAAGVPDIFMNILTTNGLVSRYLTDWAGPGARVKNIKFRLGAPNFPGDTMVFSGLVAAKSEEDGETFLDVEYKGKNGIGYHVTGTATLGFK